MLHGHFLVECFRDRDHFAHDPVGRHSVESREIPGAADPDPAVSGTKVSGTGKEAQTSSTSFLILMMVVSPSGSLQISLVQLAIFLQRKEDFSCKQDERL